MTGQAKNTDQEIETKVEELTSEDLAQVTGGLTKVGAGTLTLGVANTYRGSTTVSEGE